VTRFLRRLWVELCRPRGIGRHRFYRVGRSSRAGIAMLLVLTSLFFMMVVVTEIVHGASVRIQLAAHQRDEAMAEALANTGVQTYRLILVASKGIGQQFGAMMSQFGLGGDTLWEMVPFINTGMMRMLLVSGSGLDEEEVEEFEEEGLTDEQRAESREAKASSSKRNFLDFDGDFFAEVTDEDHKVHVGSFQATSFAELLGDYRAMQLYNLMSGEENDQFFYDENIDRWEIIGDLADWTDADDDRVYRGGSELTLYQRLEDPYRPKNAPFDSMQEVRLVNGWHRDDIWERFGDHLTIYGGGKINVNTAGREELLALLRTYVTPNTPQYLDLLLSEINIYKSLANYPNAQSFVRHLESLGATVDSRMQNAITNESSVFRITSTGQVRDAVVTIEAIVDFSGSSLGKITYWRVD